MSSSAIEQAALHHLRITPDLIAELMEGMSATQAIAKPSSGEYSLAELLEYLSHSEGHCFRIRLDALLAPESSGTVDLPAYDRELLFAAGTYSGRDPDESFAHWQERRDDSIELLDALKPKQIPKVEALLRDWAAHDLCALRQITRRVSEQLYGA